jgi:hypothetical protein
MQFKKKSNMTPKEKALELIDKYQFILTEKHFAKQCALIAVDEIRDNLPLITDIQNYWLEVKQEIQAL